MTSYSSIFTEILTNNQLKNEFVQFFDSAANTVKYAHMPVEVIQNKEDIAILQPQVEALQTGLTGVQGDIVELHSGLTGVQGDVVELHTGLTGVQGSISTLDTKINNWSNIAPVGDLHFGLNQLHGHETYGLIMGTHLAMHYKDILDCGTLHTSNIKSALGGLVTINSNVTLHNNALTCGTINSSTITSLQDQITALPADLSTWAANVASEDVKLGTHTLDFGSGTVKLEAQGDQLTTLGSFYAQKNITCNDYLQTNGDAYLGYDQSKSTVFVDKTNKLLTTDFEDVSITKFKDITISGTLTADTLKYTTLEPAIPGPVEYVLTYFVDANGDDSYVGNASFPFATIGKAVATATAAYVADGHIRNVIVAQGSYAETITITKPIQLTGSCSSRYAKDCKITGDILVQLAGTVDMHASKVTITGFLVVGRILNTSSSVHCLLVKDAFLYAPDHCVYHNAQSNIDSRCYIENVSVNGSDTISILPLVEVSSGALVMSQCSLSSKSLQNVFTLSGTAELWGASLCSFENSHNGASLPALARLSTSKYTKVKVFAYCSFVYTSPTAKANGQNTNTGIYVDGQAGSLLMVSSNTFSLAGVASGNVIHGGVGSAVVFYANNYSMGSNASPMAAGIVGSLNQTKFACTPVS